MFLYILGGIVIFLVLVFVLICIYAFFKGTDDTSVMVEKKTALKLEKISDTEAVFSTEFPMINRGKEDAAILDVFARPYLPQEQFNAATVFGHIETSTCRRNDNYFEALILKADTQCQLILTLRFVANNGMNIREALQQMVDMDVAVYYNGLARKNIYIRKAFLTINGETIRNLVGGAENGK